MADRFDVVVIGAGPAGEHALDVLLDAVAGVSQPSFDWPEVPRLPTLASDDEGACLAVNRALPLPRRKR